MYLRNLAKHAFISTPLVFEFVDRIRSGQNPIMATGAMALNWAFWEALGPAGIAFSMAMMVPEVTRMGLNYYGARLGFLARAYQGNTQGFGTVFMDSPEVAQLRELSMAGIRRSRLAIGTAIGREATLYHR